MRLPNNLKANIPPFTTALTSAKRSKEQHIFVFSIAIFNTHTHKAVEKVSNNYFWEISIQSIIFNNYCPYV